MRFRGRSRGEQRDDGAIERRGDDLPPAELPEEAGGADEAGLDEAETESSAAEPAADGARLPADAEPADRGARHPAAEAAAAIRAAAEAAAYEQEPAEPRAGAPQEPAAAAASTAQARPAGGASTSHAPAADDSSVRGAHAAPEVVAPNERIADLRLARIHLRTGAFALARAELEMLAGEERLDTDATIDLAEVRWRTGDLAGAAEAAASYLAAGGDDALAFVIAAEGAAAGDRPAEARRLAGKALERSEASLDAVFAGIPRSMIWPHDSWAEPAGGLFGAQPEGTSPGSGGAAAPPPTGPFGALRRPEAGEAPAQPGPGRGGAQQRGLWETSAPEPEPLDADSEIAAAAAALAVGDEALAALHLGVALRLAPSAAGAVVQAIGNRREPLLELVRGDALRLLGYEWDARRAYLSVAAGLRAAREMGEEAAERSVAPTRNAEE